MDDQTLSGITNPVTHNTPPHRARNRMMVAIAVLASALVLLELFLSYEDGSFTIPYISQPMGVAKVTAVDGDARYQPAAEREWYKAKTASDLYSGDAIYSGASAAVGVEMKSGGQLSLGEETLVIFDSIDGVTIPDLARGNIKLRILGDMKISISGDESQYSAGESGEAEVLISIDESSKGKIQVLSGRPKITAPKQAAKFVEAGSYLEFVVRKFRLSSRKQIELPADTKPLPRRIPVESIADKKPVPDVTPVVPPNPAELKTEVLHTLTKSDLYEPNTGIRLKARKRLDFVQAPGVLRWNGGNGAKTFVQATTIKENQKPNFEDCWFNESARGQDVVLMKWRPGKSVWRVSSDGVNWSDPASIDVITRFSIGRDPLLTIENPNVRFPNPVVRMSLSDESGRKMSGWIIEGGRDHTFKKAVSVWAESSKLIVPLSKLGTYYFRVRSVDEHGEVSSPSNVRLVTVGKEKPKPVPVRIAKKTKPEVPDREVATEEVAEEVAEEVPGESTSFTKLDAPELARSFVRAGPFAISILGGLGSVISVDQTEAGIAPPVIQLIGLAGSYFDGRYETKVSYRSRIGVSSGTGGAPSASRLDLRGGRWWTLGWRPFKTQTRFGLIAGYENYQNSDSQDFSPFYEVAKAGLGVNIDLTERVQTGGTVLFGTWMNSNWVSEIDGYFAYDFLENLNLGIGYRIGLFEAGTITSSPSTLPYREATGEAYSQLKFSF